MLTCCKLYNQEERLFTVKKKGEEIQHFAADCKCDKIPTTLCRIADEHSIKGFFESQNLQIFFYIRFTLIEDLLISVGHFTIHT